MTDETKAGTSQENSNGGDQHAKRDAETQTAIGIFVIVMAVFVLIGTFYAVHAHAMVVNVIAGLVLLAIGVWMVALGRKTAKRA